MGLNAEYVLGAEEYLSAAWTADVDLTVSPVQMAVVPQGIIPTDVDWVTAEWTPGQANRSRVLFDTTFYGVGIFGVWGRVTDSPETIVRQHGTVRVI